MFIWVDLWFHPASRVAAVSRLIVVSDDWGRHPSSCQHLIRPLLDRHAVTWLNTIGMRKPRLSPDDVAKATLRIRDWIASAVRMPRRARGADPRLHVVTPPMWPSFRRTWQRRANAALVQRTLDRALPPDRTDCVVLTTLPIAAVLSGALPPCPWIYYCVDDFRSWPGLDGELMDDLERRLVARADRVVAASAVLSERLTALGARPVLLTHGVDLAHWRNARPNDPALLPPAVARWARTLARPIILFWGLIDRRLDTEWLRAAAGAAGSLVLAGPRQDHDPSIAALPNVVMPGPVPYETLPALAARADALLMPYADMPVTRAMQPLKLKEYLATDRPVILRALPAAREWGDAADVVDSAGELARALTERLRGGVPEAQLRARRRLEHESWELKARELEAIVAECLGGRR